MKKTVIHGLYFDSARKRYTHRPWINGRRTERTLDARTEREAIKEFGRLCSGVAPIHTVKSLILEYVKAGTPGRGRTARDGEFAAGEIRRCEMLSQFFGSMRTAEALSLRHDAKIGQPGHIREEDGQRYLCIARLKQGQEDPFDYLPINPHLAKVLTLLPKCSTWYFPGAHKGKHLDKDSLSHALREIAAELYPGRRLTSHGCRSFYITWQLACGVDPYQIARAVGHRSGVGLILKTYGRRLPAWAGKGFGPEPATGATGAYWDSTTGLSSEVPVNVGASTSSNTSLVRITGILQSTTGHSEPEISNVIILVPSHLAHTSTC